MENAFYIFIEFYIIFLSMKKYHFYRARKKIVIFFLPLPYLITQCHIIFKNNQMISIEAQRVRNLIIFFLKFFSNDLNMKKITFCMPRKNYHIFPKKYFNTIYHYYK